MKIPTAKEAAKLNQRRAALKARIAAGGQLNPETLAHSYGLTVADVERAFREMEVSCG